MKNDEALEENHLIVENAMLRKKVQALRGQLTDARTALRHTEDALESAHQNCWIAVSKKDLRSRAAVAQSEKAAARCDRLEAQLINAKKKAERRENIAGMLTLGYMISGLLGLHLGITGQVPIMLPILLLLGGIGTASIGGFGGNA